MSLSDSQIKFIEQNAKGNSQKEIRDMVGLLYKQNVRKFIKKQKEPKSIKEIFITRKLLDKHW
jgi:transcriptional regulator